MDIHAVCARAAQICDDLNIGYSQPGRWNLYPGGSTDCSALVADAYNHGGATPQFPRDTWTGNLRAYAAERGFTVLDWTPPAALAPGDALLSEASSGGVGHVAIYTGDDCLREAWISETGDIDGAPGDQTDAETRTVAYSTHPHTLSGAWTHILRPPSGYTTPTPTIEGEDLMNNDQLTQLMNAAWLINNAHHGVLARLDRARVEDEARDTAMMSAIKALAASQGADPDKIADLVREEVRAALSNLRATVTLAPAEEAAK